MKPWSYPIQDDNAIRCWWMADPASALEAFEALEVLTVLTEGGDDEC